jgi:hypothetical protein
MPRYGINVQYAPSPWEKVMPAIGSAIDQYQRKQDADRSEENQIAAQGGTPIGAPEPSRLDRVRQFLRKKVLGGTDPGAPAAPAPVQSGVADTPVTTQVPAVQGVTAPGGSSLLGGATPTPPAAPRRIGDALLYDPSTDRCPGPPLVVVLRRRHPGHDREPGCESGSGRALGAGQRADAARRGSVARVRLDRRCAQAVHLHGGQRPEVRDRPDARLEHGAGREARRGAG